MVRAEKAYNGSLQLKLKLACISQSLPAVPQALLQLGKKVKGVGNL